MRLGAISLVCALLVLAGSAPASAQPRAAAPSPAEARAQFGVILQAATQLATVQGAGRNLRGGLQSWDRRWRSRLRSLGRAVLPTAPSGAECELHEIAHLVGGTALSVWNARMFLFSEETASLVSMARELAVRRVLADEAAHRRSTRLSCADLPDAAQVESALAAPPSDVAAIRSFLEIAHHGRAGAIPAAR